MYTQIHKASTLNCNFPNFETEMLKPIKTYFENNCKCALNLHYNYIGKTA